VLKWRDRRGIRQKAVIEGTGRGRRGFYRRIRVSLYRPGAGIRASITWSGRRG
jgi:hypothetical protein